jgi:hypothetical protein
MAITDDDIESALSWMVKNSEKAAKARADRLFIEESLKPLKAKLMKDSGQESLGAQEREALANPLYQAQLEGLRAAVYEDELFRLRYKSADARIEAWRTMSSNNRSMGKVT